MAAADGRSSALGAALRMELMAAASVGSGENFGDELSEDVVWGEYEEEAGAEERDSDSGFEEQAYNEFAPSTGRVVSRYGWDVNSTPLASRSRNQGLSELAAEGITRSGAGPGLAGPMTGGAGDILGATVSATPSVVISRLPPRKDAAASLRPLRRASAPVNVPDWTKVTGVGYGRRTPVHTLAAEEEEEEGNMTPPHVITAREYAKSVSFSVTEGVGRTLRGRDLEHMRTAVLRRTGFLDT